MIAELPILIVGSGPTGLTLACDLARRNISIRIIDKAPEYFNSSAAKLCSRARSRSWMTSASSIASWPMAGFICLFVPTTAPQSLARRTCTGASIPPPTFPMRLP